MTVRRPFVLAFSAALVLAVSAAPGAGAAWSPQRQIPDSTVSAGYSFGLVAGDDRAMAVWAGPGPRHVLLGSQVFAYGAEPATPLTALRVNPLSGVVALPGQHILVAGQSARGRPAYAEGPFGRELGAPRGLGIAHGTVDAVAASRNGRIAVVTLACPEADDCRRPSVVLSLRVGSRFRAPVTLARVARYTATAVSVNDTGVAVVAWASDGSVFARIVDPRGPHGVLEPPARLGPMSGNQSLQALMTNGGSAVVAWASQRVSEGDPIGPARIRVAQTARAPRRHFRPAHLLEGFSFAQTGFYLQAYRPARAVMLTQSFPCCRVGGPVLTVAWTGFEAGHFAVHAARLTAAGPRPRTTVSTGPADAFLADLSADGSFVRALWGSAPRLPGGPDVAHMQLFSARAAKAGGPDPAFGAAEPVSDIDANAIPPAGDTPFARLVEFGPQKAPSLVAVWPHWASGAPHWDLDYALSHPPAP